MKTQCIDNIPPKFKESSHRTQFSIKHQEIIAIEVFYESKENFENYSTKLKSQVFQEISTLQYYFVQRKTISNQVEKV